MVGTLLLCLARLAFARRERAVNCGKDNKHQSWPSFCVLVVVVLVFLLLLNDKSKITTGQQANIKYGDGTQHNTAEQSTAQQNTTRCNPTRQRRTRGSPPSYLNSNGSSTCGSGYGAPKYKMPKTAALHGVAPSFPPSPSLYYSRSPWSRVVKDRQKAATGKIECSLCTHTHILAHRCSTLSLSPVLVLCLSLTPTHT